MPSSGSTRLLYIIIVFLSLLLNKTNVSFTPAIRYTLRNVRIFHVHNLTISKFVINIPYVV